MYYIYILFSEASNKYYIGHTNDIERRLNEHNDSGRFTYTSKRRPWKMCALFECSSVRKEALAVERYIKRQKSRRLIQQMIDGEKLNGRLAQLLQSRNMKILFFIILAFLSVE